MVRELKRTGYSNTIAFIITTQTIPYQSILEREEQIRDSLTTKVLKNKSRIVYCGVDDVTISEARALANRADADRMFDHGKKEICWCSEKFPLMDQSLVFMWCTEEMKNKDVNETGSSVEFMVSATLIETPDGRNEVTMITE